MSISWGYSPKVEQFIPLADFPADKYLIIAKQAIENLGWNLSHVSETGIIAYTPISFQSYSEEISIRIHGNFALVKSECVGIQMWFNDYGKNSQNLEKFFHEFEYVQFHLKDIWEERLTEFHEFIATQDDSYFDKAPLATKDKIKNILYLFFPQKGYFLTPILIITNTIYWLFTKVVSVFYYQYFYRQALKTNSPESLITKMDDLILNFGVNNRNLVLDGQYWRLITHQFVHNSFVHLFFNMYSLVYIGLMIENKLGWKKFLFIYIFSGVCGGLTSLLFHENGVMMGASGAIMGLFGSFLALLVNKSFEKNAAKSLLISTSIVTAIILFNGFTTKRTDNAAHIGGIVSGFIFCYILVADLSKVRFEKPIFRYGLSSVLLLLYAIVIITATPNYQTDKYRRLKYEFSKNLISYNAVLYLKTALTKDEKLHQIEEFGIKEGQKNINVAQKMMPLKLKELDAYDRRIKTEIAERSLNVAKLIRRDIQADSLTRYSKQTTKEIENLLMLTYKLRDSLNNAQ
ncbi:rhomboid family intramembrane serine protease [Pedobacter rhodius]|uniref:Rhomboid family intramembrane serine protease n=1 Tax=Pedobacter rhodius TaxID=3004098 RepID=A0ABT4KZE9_9SPHI|nr:rhomboid family intramembrane serine protease [Pedobacter sp. SJ11]MCZ4224302.1 rhomboid family intramembrane serine protease [Pedobacter sp. SJ11]